MRRGLLSILIIGMIFAALGVGGYYFNQYWTTRYDELIVRQAGVYNLDPNLVWGLIYEETYFRTSVIGDAEEVGLMQVTPTVAKEWSNETGLREFREMTDQNVRKLLSDPERNIQIGCWYLEKVRTNYRGLPAEKALMLAAYNAGPSRVEEWTKGKNTETLSEPEFIENIGISTTKSYVSSILKRLAEYKYRLEKKDPKVEQKKQEDKQNSNSEPQ